MAITAEELRILVRAETKNARDELNRFRKTSKDTTMDLKKMAKALIGPLSITAGIALLTKGVSGFIKDGINFNMQLEQMSVSFTTLLGTASAAADMMEQLVEFSASTPLQLTNIADGAKRLLAFGTEAKDVVNTMRMLGDAAMGNAAVLDRLVLSYGKVQAKGRASLEELNMFTEAGVPLMAELAKNLGLTNEELFKFVSAGKVGFEEVDAALRSLTTGQGKFAGLLEAQSRTLAGSASTLKDNFALLKAELTEGLTPGLIESNLWLTEKVNTMREAVAAGNALFRVLSNLTVNVNELALAEEEAFLAARVRDTKEAIIGLEKRVAQLSGQTFEGMLRRGFEAARKALIGIDRSLALETEDQLFRLMTLLEGDEKRLAVAQEQLAIQKELNDVQVAEALRLSAAEALAKAASDLGNSTAKTFLASLVLGLEGSEAFIFQIPIASVFEGISPEVAESVFDIFANIPTTKIKEAGKEAGGVFKDAFVNEFEGVSPTISDSLFDIFANIPELSLKPIKEDFDNLKQSLQDIVAEASAVKLQQQMENLGKSIVSMALTQGLELLKDYGKALTQGATGADTFAEAIENTLQSILNALPNMLLMTGLQQLFAGNFAVGLALIGASGLIAIGAGLFEGERENRANGQPSMSPFSAGGNQNVTVNQFNIGGNIITQRQLVETVTATQTADSRSF